MKLSGFYPSGRSTPIWITRPDGATSRVQFMMPSSDVVFDIDRGKLIEAIGAADPELPVTDGEDTYSSVTEIEKAIAEKTIDDDRDRRGPQQHERERAARCAAEILNKPGNRVSNTAGDVLALADWILRGEAAFDEES